MNEKGTFEWAWNEEGAPKSCTGCGGKLEPGQNFCPKCGKPTEGKKAEAPAERTAPNSVPGKPRDEPAKQWLKKHRAYFPEDKLGLVEHQIDTMSTEQKSAFMSVKLRNTSPISLLFIILSDVGIAVYGFIIMTMYFIGLRGENLLLGIKVPPRVDLGIWVAVISLAGMGLSWLLAILFHVWDATVNYNRVLPCLNLSGSEASPTSLTRARTGALLFIAGVIAVLVALRAFYLDVTLDDQKTYARAEEPLSADDCIAKGLPLTRSAYKEISEAMNYQSPDREENERQHARFRGKRAVVRARIVKTDSKLLGGVKIQIDLYGARVWLNSPNMSTSKAKTFQPGQIITAEGRIGDALLHELKFHDCVIRSVE